METGTRSQKSQNNRLSGIIHRLAKMMVSGEITSGELADLRRIDNRRQLQPAFYRLLVQVIDRKGQLSQDAEKKWALIVNCMALMAPYHHHADRPLGRVLAESDFSELRLARLLRGRGDSLDSNIRRMARFLKAKAQPFNWTQLAVLILATGQQKSEQVRRQIARDYYSHSSH